MARRTIQRGSVGEDVRLAQQLLLHAGFDPGPIDGIFGAQTDSATRRFQAARGLEVDGAIGPITWGALTSSAPSPGTSARGRSLHIGLNVVDDAAYGVAVPVLRGCVNDARDMLALAQAQGFSGTTLFDAQGTSTNVVGAIDAAARDLRSGDFFLLTYSGHGSQMPDTSADDDGETDALDETWVLYDRQLLDDELTALWGRFQPGVRILVLSDSCHSGTVTREVQLAYQALAASTPDSRDAGFLPSPNGSRDLASLRVPVSRGTDGWSQLEASVREVMPGVVAQMTSGLAVRETVEVEPYVRAVLDSIVPDTGLDGGPRSGPVVLDTAPVTRDLPPAMAAQDASARRDVYLAAKQAVSRAVPPAASVLLISGCQDNQLSLDGQRNGLFTQRLLEAWAGGSFSGTGYPDLHSRILSVMPPQQTPNLFWATPRDVAFEQQRPFTI